MKINLGSGNNYLEGYTNLDYNTKYNVDVTHNLDVFPYPFKDNQFDFILCSHILEHVENLYATLDELNRILADNGKIKVIVPHFSNGIGYNDLTHKRFFGLSTFKMLEEGYFNYSFPFKVLSQKLVCTKDHRIYNFLCSWIYNVIPVSFYERFLCWIFPVGQIEIILERK